MAFRYEEVVPWGRSFDEYLRMFELGEAELAAGLLGCGDGPASFNCEMWRRGRRVISADPIYALPPPVLARRIDETYNDVMAQTRRERHQFVWDAIRSVEELGTVRMTAMRAFLDDWAASCDGRYVAAALPHLPFRTRQFDLALCSHLLFFYAERLSREFHRRSLRELARVAGEVRVFPLVDVNARPSPHVDPLLAELDDELDWEIRTVPYEFQRGGNQMLLLRARS